MEAKSMAEKSVFKIKTMVEIAAEGEVEETATADVVAIAANSELYQIASPCLAKS